MLGRCNLCLDVNSVGWQNRKPPANGAGGGLGETIEVRQILASSLIVLQEFQSLVKLG